MDNILGQEMWVWAVKPGLGAEATQQNLEAAQKAYTRRFGVAGPERPAVTVVCGRGWLRLVHWCYVMPGQSLGVVYGATTEDREQLSLFGEDG